METHGQTLTPAPSLDRKPSTNLFIDDKTRKLLESVSKFASSSYKVTAASVIGDGVNNIVISAQLAIKKSVVVDQQATPRKRTRLLSKILGMLKLRSSYTTLSTTFRFPNSFGYDEPRVGHRVKHNAALLSFLYDRKVNFRVPRAFEYDATGSNLMGNPYILLEYIPGIMLCDIYNKLDLNLDQKLQIAKEVLNVIVGMESVTFNEIGRLVAADDAPDSSGWLRGNSAKICNLKVGSFNVWSGDIIQKTNPACTLKDLVFELLESYIEVELKKEELSARYSLKKHWFGQLRRAAESMDEPGWFELAHSPIVLKHWDFEPYNILVQINRSFLSGSAIGSDGYFDGLPTDSSIKVVAVIDWDRATAVPTILSRLPPIWLWDDPLIYNYGSDTVRRGCDGDPDLYPTNWYNEDGGRLLSEENKRIKEYFDRLAEETLSGYAEYAYGSRGRWLRRLTRFLFEGFEGTEEPYRLQYFAKDWMEEFGQQLDSDCEDDVSEGDISEDHISEDEISGQEEEEEGSDRPSNGTFRDS